MTRNHQEILDSEIRTLSTNDVEIWTQGFGNPTSPTVLLIMGATAQGIMWLESLIQKIVATGNHVVRYDHRDVGRSTCGDFGTNPYTLDDLTDDAIAVLDGWGVDKAHVVGASMGGMIVQLLMIKAPERLLSATMICSSPLAGPGFTEDLQRGPFLEAMDKSSPVDAPKTKTEWIEHQVAFSAALADPAAFDCAELEKTLSAVYDRASDLKAANNHSLAIGRSQPVDRRPLLVDCKTPTTVIHGCKDPIFPLPHGQAIADAIPGAQMFVFENMAHDLPEYCWPVILDRISSN